MPNAGLTPKASEQQEALDALFGGTDLLDDVEDDGEEPEPGTPPRISVTSSNRDKPFQRHNHLKPRRLQERL